MSIPFLRYSQWETGPVSAEPLARQAVIRPHKRAVGSGIPVTIEQALEFQPVDAGGRPLVVQQLTVVARLTQVAVPFA